MELELDDINYLNIFPHVGHAATMDLLEVRTEGGNLPAGSYTFALRYLDSLGTPTNFFTSTQQIAVPVYVGSRSWPVGADGEATATGSIRLGIYNIDTHYDRLQLAVIPQYDGVIGTPQLFSPMTIIDEQASFIYNGNESTIESSIDEILSEKASYSRAKTIAQVDETLYMGNMTRHEPLDYQKYANNIKVRAVVESYDGFFTTGSESFISSGEGNLGNPTELAYNARGFKRGETYAFYISFILNDGTESPAFHIPGRAPTSFNYNGEEYQEDDRIPSEQTYLRQISGLNEDDEPLGRWFQFLSKPHPEYNTGYWENADEYYPYSTDWEIWDVDENGEGEFVGQTLSGKNVRHHQMPDADEEPMFDAADNLRVLGVRFEDIKIPSEIRERVKAFRIHYAKRSIADQRVIDQSFVTVPNIVNFNDRTVHISRVSHRSTVLEDDMNPIPNSLSMLLHPFNTLRTGQNVQGITHLKVVGQSIADNGGISGSHDSFNWQFTEDLVNNLFMTADESKQFAPVDGAIFLPSYGFSEGEANRLVRTEGMLGTAEDFDNTNGEEKVLVEAHNIIYEDDDPESPIPYYLVDICQYRQNVFLGFDLQELTYTGFQEYDLDRYDPSADDSPSPSPSPDLDAFQTDKVFGGDTFLGIYVSKHTRWLESDPGGDVDLPQDQAIQCLRYSLVESYAYPQYRSEGEDFWDQWSPGTTDIESHVALIWLDSQPNGDDLEGDVFPGDPIRYNVDYLMNETMRPAFPLLKRRSEIQRLPTRVIRGRQDQVEQDTDPFRQFLADDFIDLPTFRGPLNKLLSVNNILIPHMQRSMMRTRGREELQTEDFRAFLGSGDIFSVKPEEFQQTDVGHGGIQHLRSGLVTEYGYLFVDQAARKVYLLGPQGMQNINKAGMEQFLEEHLAFNFESYGFDPSQVGISPYFGIGVGWDPEYERYIITKKDLRFVEDISGDSPSPSPGADDLVFDEDAQLFEDPDQEEGFLDWDDEDYFEDDSFTLSYSPELKAWISFHDYFPDMYFFNVNRLYSGFDAVLYKHNDHTLPGRFYGERFDSMLEYIDNRNPATSKTVASLFIDSEVRNQDNRIQRDKTVDRIRVYNTYQDTGYIDVTYFEDGGNARYARGHWRINELRNIQGTDGELQEDLDWYELDFLSDRYHHVILEKDNSDNNLLFLVASELNIKQSLR